MNKETVHEETITLTGDLPGLKIKVGATAVETPAPAPEVVASAAPVVSTPSQSTQGVVPIPQTAEASGGPSNDFILNELNFEIKKLTAEFKHLTREMDDLKALSKM